MDANKRSTLAKVGSENGSDLLSFWKKPRRSDMTASTAANRGLLDHRRNEDELARSVLLDFAATTPAPRTRAGPAVDLTTDDEDEALHTPAVAAPAPVLAPDSSNKPASLAFALCLRHASAFAGVVGGRGGATRNAVAGGWANAAVPQRAMVDGGEQQLQMAASTVSLPEGDLSKKSGGGGDGLLASYLRALDDKPITTKVITSGVICGIGDILAQALSYKLAATEAINLGGLLATLEFKRFAVYTFLGAVWIAPVVHYWFDLLEQQFKDKKGSPAPSFAMKMFKALKMVTVDQTIGAPLVNAGIIFLVPFLNAVTAGAGPFGAVKKAGELLKEGILPTMLVCWKIWPIANMINFAFVPAKLRVLFMNFVGLGWNIYLSAAVN
eukprot:g12999.t1